MEDGEGMKEKKRRKLPPTPAVVVPMPVPLHSVHTLIQKTALTSVTFRHKINPLTHALQCSTFQRTVT